MEERVTRRRAIEPTARRVGLLARLSESEPLSSEPSLNSVNIFFPRLRIISLNIVADVLLRLTRLK